MKYKIKKMLIGCALPILSVQPFYLFSCSKTDSCSIVGLEKDIYGYKNDSNEANKSLQFLLNGQLVAKENVCWDITNKTTDKIFIKNDSYITWENLDIGDYPIKVRGEYFNSDKNKIYFAYKDFVLHIQDTKVEISIKNEDSIEIKQGSEGEKSDFFQLSINDSVIDSDEISKFDNLEWQLEWIDPSQQGNWFSVERTSGKLIWNTTEENSVVGLYIFTMHLMYTDDVGKNKIIDLNANFYVNVISDVVEVSKFKFSKENAEEPDAVVETKTYYSNSFFNNPSNIYVPSLMSLTTCAVLSSAPIAESTQYGEDKLIHYFYDQINFENFYSNDYYRSTETGPDTMGVAYATREYDPNYTIVSVTMRSWGYQKEWAGNAILGEEGFHEGFYTGAKIAFNGLVGYLNDNKSKLHKKIKLWISGGSRGGAVANLLGALIDLYLDGKPYDGKELPDGFSFSKDDTYVYCVNPATGGVKTDQIDPKSNIFDNIFSQKDIDDIVPYVCPSAWGFMNFGNELFVPNSFFWQYQDKDAFNNIVSTFKTNVDDLESYFNWDNFNDWHGYNRMIDDEKEDADDEHQKNLHPFFAEKNIVDELVDAIGTRKNYVKKYQKTVANILEEVLGNKGHIQDIILQVIKELASVIFNVLDDSKTYVSLATVVKQIEKMIAHHSYTIALGWARSNDPLFVDSKVVGLEKSYLYYVITTKAYNNVKLIDQSTSTYTPVYLNGGYFSNLIELNKDGEKFGAVFYSQTIATAEYTQIYIPYIPNKKYEVQGQANVKAWHTATAMLECYNTSLYKFNQLYSYSEKVSPFTNGNLNFSFYI